MAAPTYSTRYSTRNNFVEPPSIASRIAGTLPAGVAARVQNLTSIQSSAVSQRNWRKRIGFRALLSLPNVCILIWFVVLLWGERWVFNDSITACDWKNWERWPSGSTPHHLILLADPQLIDPHTYPGRPWPLSTFTIWHTDNYLYRSYYRLQQNLRPDTLFFLGDLFDGGREWGTRQSKNKDSVSLQEKRPSQEKSYVKAWKSYGDDYWLKEYNRFGKIFFKYWNVGGEEPGRGQRGRRIIASLPGNHDLGFGENIQIPIRNRFNAYFGDGNRVDVIGNHSFVSIDSVSLSAGPRDQEISAPVEAFLADVQVSKRKAISRELRYQRGESTDLANRHVVKDLATADFTNYPSLLDETSEISDLPTILLTHVPLYRKVGEPCGPLRERYPPTPHPRKTPSINPDERNAISITAGFQYQNVLGDQDSIRVVSSIGNVISAFSGDDHDYCEVIHQADKNNVREITVKSMSYAMGVRKPGFLMLSMWNPIDASGHSLDSQGARVTRKTTTTIQTHLCLLPDQLGILIRYAMLIGVTVFILLINAILTPFINPSRLGLASSQGSGPNDSILPTSSKDIEAGYRNPASESNGKANSSTSSTSAGKQNGLAVRPNRSKSLGPGNGGYGIPVAFQDHNLEQPTFTTYPLSQEKRWDYREEASSWGSRDGYSNGKTREHITYGARKEGKIRVVLREAWRSIWRVTWVVVLIFLCIAKFG